MGLFHSSKFQEDLTQYDYEILKEFVKEREENKQLVFKDL